MSKLFLATFRIDATVPIGHPLSGGLVMEAKRIADPLYATGVVLVTDDAPVVICAVDWEGLCNEADIVIRDKLARAAGTTRDCVAVQCVHQHDAPIFDPRAAAIGEGKPGFPSIADAGFFDSVTDRLAEAVEESLHAMQAVSHVGFGAAAVERVASTRRVMGPDGKVAATRFSASTDPKLRDAPEGLIDPFLKTVAFWNGDTKLAVLHYYATHPMSIYGQGGVSADFVGAARRRRITEDGGIPHIYFNGAGGNIAPGKYNDRSESAQAELISRLHRAMVESERTAQRRPVHAFQWRHEAVMLAQRGDIDEAGLRAVVADADAKPWDRIAAAMHVGFRERARDGVPFSLSSLHLGEACLLHLPAEAFVEYQLYAQGLRPDGFVATAAYGDCAPWYIPTERAFDEGGFEPTWAFADRTSERLLRPAIERLVGK